MTSSDNRNPVADPSVGAAPRSAGQDGGSSRRRFLRRTVVGGVSLAGALPVVASALSGPPEAARDGTVVAGSTQGRADDPLLEVLRRHGSEFGGIDRVS